MGGKGGKEEEVQEVESEKVFFFFRPLDLVNFCFTFVFSLAFFSLFARSEWSASSSFFLSQSRRKECALISPSLSHTMAAAAAALAPELAAALMPDESASAYLRRSAPLPVRTGLWFAPALRPGQAVEFGGPSDSGKTALLVQVRG